MTTEGAGFRVKAPPGWSLGTSALPDTRAHARSAGRLRRASSAPRPPRPRLSPWGASGPRWPPGTWLGSLGL